MIIPKCVRFTASSPLSFDQCLSRNGFSYPVLVRPSQRQTGVRVVRVDGPEDRQRVVHLPWSGQPHVITEFVDIAKAFFPEGKEPKFVNAVLDHMAREAKPEAF